MLRTKKQQLNLKPNRVLDKRSSRGMLFENEELRLRTIHINDEVEKGHNDIKKLRKENEYLKREIWSLRDECEKLEEVLKKVYSGDAPPINELPVYQPRVRKSSTISGIGWGGSRRASGVSMNFLNSYDANDENDTENSYDDQQQQDQYLEQELDEAEFEEDEIRHYDDSEPFVCDQQNSPCLQHQQNYGVINEENQQQQQHYMTDTVENQQKGNFYQTQTSVPSSPGHHHHHWHLHSPELEAVTEESENTSNSNHNSIIASNNSNDSANGNDRVSTIVSIHPPPDILFIDSSSVHSETPIPGGDLDSLSVEFFNPTIEITPASSSTTLGPTSGGKQQTDTSTCGVTLEMTNSHSSSSSPNNVNKLNNECSPSAALLSGHDVQERVELGCVTLIPKKYQVTSELKITPNSLSNSIEEIPPPQTLDKLNESSLLEPSSHSQFGQSSEDEEKEKNESTTPTHPPSIQISKKPNPETAKDKRQYFTSGHPSKLPHRPPRLNFSNYNRNNPTPTGTSCTLSYYSDSKFAKKKLDPLYQSEPSLSSLLVETAGEGLEFDSTYLRVPPSSDGWRYSGFISEGFNGYDQSVEMCTRIVNNNNLIGDTTRENTKGDFYDGWNSVDKNVVIGYLDGGMSDEVSGVTNNSTSQGATTNDLLYSDLTAQEIIDELEIQFDPTLEKIAGVRMLTLPGYFAKPRRVFFSLRTAVSVKMFIEKGFTLRGQQVKLIDASKTRTSVVILTGLPSSFPDASVISILNEFGQVTAPLERRVYKGVDISERLARMHLVKNLRPALNIAGYEVVAKVVAFNVPPTSNNSDNFDGHQHGGGGTTPPIPPSSPSIKQMTRPVNFRQNSTSSTLPPPLPPSSSPVLTLTSVPFPSTSGIPIPRPHKKIGKSTSMMATSPTQDNPTNNTGSSSNNQSPHLHHYLSSSSGSTSAPVQTQTSCALGPTAQAINKRKMSVCSAVMDQGCSISNNPHGPKSPGIAQPMSSGAQQQQQQKAYLGNPKKPLSRLPRSSPGSLVPQPQQQLQSPQYGAGQLGDPNLMSVVDSTGVKPLVRSLSFEPRRISSGSQRGHGSESSLADSQQFQFHSQQFHQGHHGGSIMMHHPANATHRQSQQSRFYQPHGQLSQNNSSHSHFHSLDKNESLPWCGCWGNGCI